MAPSSQSEPDPENLPGLQVTSHGMSDRGQKRTSNEDCFVIAEFARTLSVRHTNIPHPNPTYSSHRGHVFLVADGVGGRNAGEVASALSVTTIEEFLLNTFRRLTILPPGDEHKVLNELKAALFQADARIFQETAQNPELKGMGSTLTMALAVNRRLLVAHAGDSRCYLYSGGRLQKITNDHTITAELQRTGLLSAEDAAVHPWRHVVSNLLGGSEPGVRVEVHSMELHKDDVILLCSDGLTEMIPEKDIAEVLRVEPTPQLACEKLVAEANHLGGRDNITVIVAHVDSLS